MKSKLFILFVLIIIVHAFQSCSKDEPSADDKISSADIETIKTAVTGGDWRITYYFDSGKDETSDYDGYIFTFNSDGTLGATNGNVSLSGAWAVTDSSNSNDDSSSGDVDFEIFFSSQEIFLELTDDWDIKKYANNKIELFDISGGDGTTDYLTFEKN